MGKSNPKTHDSLFKWLITVFLKDFFAHYFPKVKLGKYEIINKEFLSKYEALKQSIEADLFIAVEAEIDGDSIDIIIHIEHQSSKKDKTHKGMEYFCYGWLLKQKA